MRILPGQLLLEMGVRRLVGGPRVGVKVTAEQDKVGLAGLNGVHQLDYLGLASLAVQYLRGELKFFVLRRSWKLVFIKGTKLQSSKAAFFHYFTGSGNSHIKFCFVT